MFTLVESIAARITPLLQISIMLMIYIEVELLTDFLRTILDPFKIPRSWGDLGYIDNGLLWD